MKPSPEYLTLLRGAIQAGYLPDSTELKLLRETKGVDDNEDSVK